MFHSWQLELVALAAACGGWSSAGLQGVFCCPYLHTMRWACLHFILAGVLSLMHPGLHSHQELVKAGCERRMLNDTFRMRSPLRGADVRWVCSCRLSSPSWICVLCQYSEVLCKLSTCTCTQMSQLQWAVKAFSISEH